MIADDVAKRPVQDVGPGVVLADPFAAGVIDFGGRFLAGLDPPFDHRAAVAVDADALAVV